MATSIADPFSLAGRRALVTGASQGIGLALAAALARAGAALVLNARDPARLARAADALRQDGAEVTLAPFDVTDGAATREAVDRVEAETGPVDILVNNAGLTRRMPLHEVSEAVWHEIMRTNLDGAFHAAQAVARHMIPRGRGKIVNICSVQGELARPGTAPYAASKGAIKMLTRGMCADWARHGIQVNALAPGYFETALTRPLVEDAAFTAWLSARTPAGRWGQVEELGGAIVFLCAPAADFVNGAVLTVDGGLTAVM